MGTAVQPTTLRNRNRKGKGQGDSKDADAEYKLVLAGEGRVRSGEALHTPPSQLNSTGTPN